MARLRSVLTAPRSARARLRRGRPSWPKDRDSRCGSGPPGEDAEAFETAFRGIGWSKPGIPEIIDLNVLPDFRRQGIGTGLMDRAEARVASRAEAIGLGVGLHAGYGAAQRLYVRRGYLPDGAGALVDGVPVPEGEAVLLNDDLCLRLTKDLTVPPPGTP